MRSEAEVSMAGRESIYPGAAPPITVLMSVHNGGKYLRESVDSILAQTFSGFLFLIIDDASTDGTPDILAEYAAADQRVRVITNAANIGLTASLNKGIALIESPYIARMDADDVSLPERFARQIEFMEAHPEVAACGTYSLIVDAEGVEVGDYSPPHTCQEINAYLHKFGSPIVHSSVMIRTGPLKNIGGYREAFLTAQDYDLWLRLSHSNRLANLPEPLILYREHGKSVTNMRMAQQAVSHILAAQAAEIRGMGMADPLSAPDITLDSTTMLSLQNQAGLPSLIMWIQLLLWRNIENKEKMLEQAWQFLLCGKKEFPSECYRLFENTCVFNSDCADSILKQLQTTAYDGAPVMTPAHSLLTLIVELRKAQNELSAMLSEKQSLLIEKQSLDDEHRRLSLERGLLQANIAGMLNSRSWRITAPLRWLARKAKRRALGSGK